MKLFSIFLVVLFTAGCVLTPVDGATKKTEENNKNPLIIDLDHSRLPTYLRAEPTQPRSQPALVQVKQSGILQIVSVIVIYNCRHANVDRVCEADARTFNPPLVRYGLSAEAVAARAVVGWLAELDGHWPSLIDHFLFRFATEQVRCRLGKPNVEPDWVCEKFGTPDEKTQPERNEGLRTGFFFCHSLHYLL
ncbi:MAG: hypothetical protein HKM24_05945 [Gammaproteobacteria bacterium]|nr:hypothetical protein [Gammaproteobacteria bacterium]